MNNLVFEYAIRFPNGEYYTGRVNSESEPNAWQGEKHEAFTYTVDGAYRKIQSVACFILCDVVKVI
jgi:hypothetical protein